MRSAAIIGYTGKGLFNTPTKVEDVKELHTTFGKKSNVTLVAEQLLFADYQPTVIRLEDDTPLASGFIVDEGGGICLSITAESPGVSGHHTNIEITREGDRFGMLVSNSGEMVEFWGNLSISDVEENINLASKWITVRVVNAVVPKSQKLDLRIESKKRSELKFATVLSALKSMDNLDVEFISLPDCDSPEIINKVLQYLEEDRPEIMLVIDPPWEHDLLQTYKWCKSLMASEQGVIFWPWLNYERKSVPPSGPVIAALLSWPFVWKPIRTKLNGVSDAAFSIHHDELAYLSKQDHFINLATKKNESLVLENRILTLAGSKLAERRLLNHVKGQISRIGKSLIMAHDPISNNFRNNFIECCEYILKPIKEDQGVNNYLVQINEFSRPEELEVDLELLLRDSVEIVNMSFKFTR